jgi:oxepin-CoA hydrolase/3-oxo-5,6-dehydrosuberyl-CoA semialdehyde dehydrogenase
MQLIAKKSTGHGSPLPSTGILWVGSGRAGGGEEMEWYACVKHYLQRTAIQGSPDMITAIRNIYQQGKIETNIRLLQKIFLEGKLATNSLVKEAFNSNRDMDAFTERRCFYAHKIDTDFSGTMFASKVAHGYF